jgi:hypothetical protein
MKKPCSGSTHSSVKALLCVRARAAFRANASSKQRPFTSSHTCQDCPAASGTFPAKCCFHVIYFISNISFVPAAGWPSAAVRGNHPVNRRG